VTPEKAHSLRRTDGEGSGDTGAVRVLLVEDETVLADAIVRGLGAEGFEVEAVHDGLEGLARAREHRYAAVILDIMLPGMNGYRVCRTLRAEGIWTPILMLTAKDGEWDEAEALDTGADDFLSKPFSFVVLVARLRALLRRGAGPRPAVLRVGDLSLDPATRECRRGDQLIDLTARELALLEHLMRHPDEVVSKRSLLEEVWGHERDADPNVVEVYAGYLRKKVDAPFGRHSIVTVRSAGYRVVDDS
jgi:two-component system, OmpR family, response regulator